MMSAPVKDHCCTNWSVRDTWALLYIKYVRMWWCLYLGEEKHQTCENTKYPLRVTCCLVQNTRTSVARYLLLGTKQDTITSCTYKSLYSGVIFFMQLLYSTRYLVLGIVDARFERRSILVPGLLHYLPISLGDNWSWSLKQSMRKSVTRYQHPTFAGR